jgi:hypothetical protein
LGRTMAEASLPTAVNGAAAWCHLDCEREEGRGKKRREEEERVAWRFKLHKSRQPVWRDSVVPPVLARLVATCRTTYDPLVTP